MANKRGNPNWGRPMLPAAVLCTEFECTEFEMQVRQLHLMPETYTSSAELRTWCERNRNNFEVNNLKPFACLAFPQTTYLKTPRKQLIFGDELVTSFWFLRRKEAAHIGLAGKWAPLLSMSVYGRTHRS
jgi:hypothetical protein